MDQELTTKSEEETAQLAVHVASSLQAGAVLCLWGDLGMGKSVFARALIRALAGEPGLDVPSPTYTLVQTYETPVGEVFHFDLYRLSVPEEIYEIGWEDALAEGIVIVEWPERLESLLPARRIDVRITGGGEGPDSRRIEVSHAGP
ncbi:MAG: tRNA (adenosine(37)-N6)-threonylcarbamoyltransferase complex ATPase subunit type 1 TsaE [Alphaproteobacteria bacterium]|nr:tRNA (adenosine(37)-N6)-threonylcarbamoyltransferase complex ATPase subunit type 1 TsaE [Alphaproteobacteria bacterium]